MSNPAEPVDKGEIPEPPQESASSLREVVARLPRMGVVVLGGVYTVGILIVNLDLGRYGLSSLELARPEYMMAGALWAFLTIAGLWGIRAAVMIARRKKSQKSRGWVIQVAWLGFIFVVAPPSAVLSAVSYGMGADAPWWSLPLAIGVVLGNAMALYGAWGVAEEALGQGPVSLKSLFAGSPPVALFLAVPMVLFSLGLYSTLVFPHVPKEFGGGRKPLVHIVVTDLSELRWEDFGLPVSKESRTIGPVVLLLETGGMFVVRRVATPGELPWSRDVQTISTLSLVLLCHKS